MIDISWLSSIQRQLPPASLIICKVINFNWIVKSMNPRGSFLVMDDQHTSFSQVANDTILRKQIGNSPTIRILERENVKFDAVDG